MAATITWRVDTALSRFARIDVLINNAGIFIPKAFTEYTTEDFNALVSTTLAGFLYVSQLSVKQMLRQKSGSIVNVSTTLGDHAMAGATAAVQIMVKGSLHSVTRALAIEYAQDGIRVNTVALGVIDTPMHESDDHESLKKVEPPRPVGQNQRSSGRHLVPHRRHLHHRRNPARRRRRPRGQVVTRRA